MKATTLRPLLIVLLFGFLPTSGWMIVRGGADHTVTRVITNSCPMPGAASHRHATGPWPATGGKRQSGALYAQPSASIGPHGPATRSSAKTPELVASAHPDGGFGDFSVPGTLSGPESGDPAAADPAPAGVPVNAFAGDPGDPGVGLLDPPGGMGMTRTGTTGTGTGGTPGIGTSGSGTPGSGSPGPVAPGTSTGGQIPTGGNSNHQVIAPEPSTLALFLAGATLLGVAALRRRHLKD